MLQKTLIKANLIAIPAVAAVTLALGASASASQITFGTEQSVVGPTDVIAPGPYTDVVGYTFDGAGSGTIAGVPFVSFPGTTTIATPYSSYGTDGQPGLYGSLLNDGQYLDGATGSVTFDVTPGVSYEVGVWIWDQRGCCQNRSDVLTGTGAGSGNSTTVAFGEGSSPAGGYVWGTFTADSTGTQTIVFSPGSNNEQVNGVVLAVVPEPASMALLGLGAVGLLAGGRRRRKA